MEINYSQPKGTCINEIFIYGWDNETVKIIDSLSLNKKIQINFLHLTESNIILISDNAEIELLTNLSAKYRLPITNTFYNSEADYAGKALICHSQAHIDIDTYYKGLYYYYPAKFWEEMENLIYMMGESGGDWEEINTVISDYCQEYDYNEIKELYKNVVCKH